MEITSFINEYIAVPALCGMMIFTGIYFLFKTGLYSPARLISLGRRAFSDSGEGGISPVSALFVSLAGTLGVGNIVGVAVAISLGGAGAVFWMMLSAALGCVLKYCEACLSVKYRQKSKKGFYGGAPYYISIGCKNRLPAVVYAILALCSSLFVGCVIQVNSAASAVYNLSGFRPAFTGLIFATVCGIVVFGGINRVSSFINKTLPVFAVIYLIISLTAICMRLNCLPAVVDRIFQEAFSFSSAVGGVGGTFISRGIRHGFAKGVLSHESGCGTSSFSHASANIKTPESQGFFGCMEVFIDTFVFGGLTALVILLSPTPCCDIYNGTELTTQSYYFYFGNTGSYILTALIVFFAFATVLAQSFYGKEALRFLTSSEKAGNFYVIAFCCSLVIGSTTAPRIIWELSDISCSLLLLLNCICMLFIRRSVPCLKKANNAKSLLVSDSISKSKHTKRSR